MPNNRGTSWSGLSYTNSDPYDKRIGNGALPVGIQGSGERAYTRTVQDNELVSKNLNKVLDENGNYIKAADQRGLEHAASRGLFNSSLAAESARRGAIEAALPIAQGDASQYGRTSSENMAALNERQLGDISADAQIQSAQIGASASMYGDDRRLQGQRENNAFSGEQNQLDRSFNTQRDYYNYRYDLGREDAQSRHRVREYAAQTGIDAHAQRNVFVNNLSQYALENPEVYTPEVIGGFFAAFTPVIDDVTDELDDYLDIWAGP